MTWSNVYLKSNKERPTKLNIDKDKLLVKKDLIYAQTDSFLIKWQRRHTNHI